MLSVVDEKIKTKLFEAPFRVHRLWHIFKEYLSLQQFPFVRLQRHFAKNELFSIFTELVLTPDSKQQEDLHQKLLKRLKVYFPDFGFNAKLKYALHILPVIQHLHSIDQHKLYLQDQQKTLISYYLAQKVLEKNLQEKKAALMMLISYRLNDEILKTSDGRKLQILFEKIKSQKLSEADLENITPYFENKVEEFKGYQALLQSEHQLQRHIDLLIQEIESQQAWILRNGFLLFSPFTLMLYGDSKNDPDYPADSVLEATAFQAQHWIAGEPFAMLITLRNRLSSWLKINFYLNHPEKADLRKNQLSSQEEKYFLNSNLSEANNRLLEEIISSAPAFFRKVPQTPDEALEQIKTEINLFVLEALQKRHGHSRDEIKKKLVRLIQYQYLKRIHEHKVRAYVHQYYQNINYYFDALPSQRLSQALEKTNYQIKNFVETDYNRDEFVRLIEQLKIFFPELCGQVFKVIPAHLTPDHVLYWIKQIQVMLPDTYIKHSKLMQDIHDVVFALHHGHFNVRNLASKQDSAFNLHLQAIDPLLDHEYFLSNEQESLAFFLLKIFTELPMEVEKPRQPASIFSLMKFIKDYEIELLPVHEYQDVLKLKTDLAWQHIYYLDAISISRYREKWLTKKNVEDMLKKTEAIYSNE